MSMYKKAKSNNLINLSKKELDKVMTKDRTGALRIKSSDLQKLQQTKAKKAKKKVTSMSSADYREAVKSGKLSTPRSSDGSVDYAFKYDVERIENGYEITLFGKHIAKNTYDGLSQRNRIRYKGAFKKAVEEFQLLNRKFFKALIPLQKSEVRYHFYSEHHAFRDRDGNSENIKKFQDTLTMLGFIPDDSLEYLDAPEKAHQYVKQEKYKMVAVLTSVE